MIRHYTFMAGGDYRCTLDIPIGSISHAFIPIKPDLKNSKIGIVMNGQVELDGELVVLSGIDFYYTQRESRGLFVVKFPLCPERLEQIRVDFSELPEGDIFDLYLVYT